MGGPRRYRSSGCPILPDKGQLRGREPKEERETSRLLFGFSRLPGCEAEDWCSHTKREVSLSVTTDSLIGELHKAVGQGLLKRWEIHPLKGKPRGPYGARNAFRRSGAEVPQDRWRERTAGSGMWTPTSF